MNEDPVFQMNNAKQIILNDEKNGKA